MSDNLVQADDLQGSSFRLNVTEAGTRSGVGRTNMYYLLDHPEMLTALGLRPVPHFRIKTTKGSARDVIPTRAFLGWLDELGAAGVELVFPSESEPA